MERRMDLEKTQKETLSLELIRFATAAGLEVTPLLCALSVLGSGDDAPELELEKPLRQPSEHHYPH